MSAFLFVGVIAPSFIVAPVSAAIYKIRHWNPSERFFVLYLLLCSIFNALAALTAKQNNLSLLHLYTLLEFGILGGFFRMIIVNRAIRTFLLIAIVCFPVFATIYAIATHSFMVYNALPRFLSGIVLTLLCIVFLVTELKQDLQATPGESYTTFNVIVVIGLLTYFSSCSALFGLSNYFMVHNSSMKIDSLVWSLHACFMILMYLIFTAAYLSIKSR